MDNSTILSALKKQRDDCYQTLISKTISAQYEELYNGFKDGSYLFYNFDEDKLNEELERLKNDKSYDLLYSERLVAYESLNNTELIKYFKTEFEKIFKAIHLSGKTDEIQAIFIEYDYYYHYKSSFTCYGKQLYPCVLEPRYISQEYDYNKQILFLNGINFEPAWLTCDGFENLEFLEIFIERLFLLHSRVLLNKALNELDSENKLDFITNKPFSFYINEHDCEVMTLYWKI